MKRFFGLLCALLLPAVAFGGYNVVEREVECTAWECYDDTGCGRYGDYFDFLWRVGEYARSVGVAELDAQIEAICRGEAEPSEEALPNAALAEALIDALNARFLHEGLAERPLVVETVFAQTVDGVRERHLRVTDPYVGTFSAMLYLPATPGPHPAVVALHGHGQTPGEFFVELGGAMYIDHGYALLIPSLRGMCATQAQPFLLHELLLHGFSLQTTSHYETMLMLKYLRFLGEGDRPLVDGARIGLLGHSGGGNTGNVTARIDAGLAAYAIDEFTEYAGGCSSFTDNMAPALFPYYPMINGSEDTLVPTLRVPYGRLAPDIVLDFFAENL